MIEKTRIIKSDSKTLTRDLPSIRYVDPDYVYLPTNNARCNKGEIYIKEGDHVNIGDKIGKTFGSFFELPILATASGEYVGLKKMFHRSGKLVDCICIKNDKKDTFAPRLGIVPDEVINNYTQEDFVRITQENGLGGLGGSGFPTYIKLATKEKIDVVLANGIECEPYLTSDYRMMIEYPRRIWRGIIYVMKAVGAKRGIVCIKKKYEPVFRTLSAVMKEEEFQGYDLSVCNVGNYYPQGWELEMIKSALGIEVPQGVLPSKYGIINFNVATIVGIYKAIRYNMPVVKRFFTVTGYGVKYPHNFRIRVGTPVKELIDLCGGYTDDKDKVVVLGGPMMGKCFVKENVITSRTSTSVLVFNKEERKEEPCVRCGSCVYSCPAGLQPVQIMNAVKRKDKEAIKKLNIKSCVECGMCSYTCTSKIHVTEYMRKAKILVR